MAPDSPDHESGSDSPRTHLLEHVRGNPGIYFSQLLRETDLARGQLAYHLRILEEKGEVVAVSRGGRKHFFPTNEFSRPARVVLSVLTLDTPRDVLLLVYEEPGITRSEVAKAVGTTTPNVSWHLDRLADAGLVDATREGRAYHYYPAVDGRLVKQLLETYHPSLWWTWSERLAETFEQMGPK